MRVLVRKFPELIQDSRKLWQNFAPQIIPDLSSAHLAKVSCFITWNTRDFMGSHISSLVDFPIVVPADGLKLFRKWIEPFLE